MGGITSAFDCGGITSAFDCGGINFFVDSIQLFLQSCEMLGGANIWKEIDCFSFLE